LTTEKQIDPNEESEEAYQKFIAGEITAVVIDREWYSSEDGDEEDIKFITGEEYNIYDLEEKYTGIEGREPWDKYYKYIDVANDGISELNLRYLYGEETDAQEDLHTYDVYIKKIDDALYIFYDTSYLDNDHAYSSMSVYGEVMTKCLLSYTMNGGNIYTNVGAKTIGQIFDSACELHNVYSNLRYDSYNSANTGDMNETLRSNLSRALSRANRELNTAYAMAIRIYDINGEEVCVLYCSRGGEGPDENAIQFLNILAECGVDCITDADIDEVIRNEESKIISNDIPDEDTYDRLWMPF
jgi:hypothetical protein